MKKKQSAGIKIDIKDLFKKYRKERFENPYRYTFADQVNRPFQDEDDEELINYYTASRHALNKKGSSYGKK